MNINHLLEKYFQLNFLEAPDNLLNYSDFLQEINCVAQILRKKKLQNGDVVLITNLPTFQFPALLFAIWKLGAIAFPFNYKLTHIQLRDACLLSNTKFIVSGEKTNDLPCIWINPNYLKQKSGQIAETFSWDLNIPATIIQTSGSTGKPKLAVHTLKNHFANALAVNTFFKTSQKDRWLLSLPLYHVAGLALIFRCVLGGCALCIPIDDDTLEENIKYHNPSHISLVPAQLWKLLENQSTVVLLKKCKVIFLGGSSIPQQLIEKSLGLGLNLYTSYGLTEAASTVAIKKISDSSTDNARILPCYDLKTNQEGEIFLKGDPLFAGYYNNGTLESGKNLENWFETRDLGETDNSRITIVGRKDNMFVSGGENIYPEEIEKELLKLKGIKQAIVVPKIDSKFGNRPVAFLDTDNNYSESEVKSQLRKSLPSFKVPNQFLSWPKQLDKGEIKSKRNYFKSLL